MTWSVVYTNDEPIFWVNDFNPKGKLKAFLQADRRAPAGEFASAEIINHLTTDLGDSLNKTYSRTKQSTIAF